jgi:hypothetical protein
VRFYGLIFDDNDGLCMDCPQIATALRPRLARSPEISFADPDLPLTLGAIRV